MDFTLSIDIKMNRLRRGLKAKARHNCRRMEEGVPQQACQEAVGAIVALGLRGIACPMNLGKMGIGG